MSLCAPTLRFVPEQRKQHNVAELDTNSFPSTHLTCSVKCSRLFFLFSAATAGLVPLLFYECLFLTGRASSSGSSTQQDVSFFCQAVISAPAKGNPVSLGSQKVSTGKLKLSVRRLKLKFIHLVFAAVRCGDRRRVVIASTREETC